MLCSINPFDVTTLKVGIAITKPLPCEGVRQYEFCCDVRASHSPLHGFSGIPNLQLQPGLLRVASVVDIYFEHFFSLKPQRGH